MNNQMHAPDHANAPSEMSFLGSATTHRLPKPGSRPTVFQGTELAMAMSYTPSVPYWYEINLYRTSEQGFVVAIRKFFQSEEEKDFVKSWNFPSLEQAFDHIEQYDASEDLPVPTMNFDDASPAELAACALSLKAEVAASRTHFSGLVGELLTEIELVGTELN